jgi:DNA-binding response OmpR family regulator
MTPKRSSKKPPSDRRATAVPPTAAPAKGRGDGWLILSVDDNDAMLFARSTVLRKEGFQVVEARNGRQALDLLDTVQPHLVLLDVNLPDMSGVDVARQIKSNPRHRGAKVIQISATFRTPRDQLFALEAGGADVYVAEPVSGDALIALIERVLRR